MRRSLFFTLFGLGGIPKKMKPVFDKEQIVISDEGMRGWLFSKNIKSPGRWCSRRLEGFSGSLVVTKKRIACFTFGRSQINISVDDPKIGKLCVGISEKGLLLISFETSDFRENWQGYMEFRFHTDKAQEFLVVLKSIGLGEFSKEVSEPGA